MFSMEDLKVQSSLEDVVEVASQVYSITKPSVWVWSQLECDERYEVVGEILTNSIYSEFLTQNNARSF